jgi:hypothetical protein
MREPIWNIMQNGTSTPVQWNEYSPNKRFAIYSPTANEAEDLVLDQETRLVWSRDAGRIGQKNWWAANNECRELKLGHRTGWRLPSVEELSSLIDTSQTNLALPAGHPFVNVQAGPTVNGYWTTTRPLNAGAAAWFVNFFREGSGPQAGSHDIGGQYFVWPVRGGSSE